MTDAREKLLALHGAPPEVDHCSTCALLRQEDPSDVEIERALALYEDAR